MKGVKSHKIFFFMIVNDLISNPTIIHTCEKPYRYREVTFLLLAHGRPITERKTATRHSDCFELKN